VNKEGKNEVFKNPRPIQKTNHFIQQMKITLMPEILMRLLS